MYLLERKRGLKWYVKIFRRLLNVSIHNAYVMTISSLVRRDKPLMTHREFRFSLARLLIDKHPHVLQPVPRPVESDLLRLRRDIVHEPRWVDSRRRCRACSELRNQRVQVRSVCLTCDAALCFVNCWRDWHSLPVINPQGRGRKRRRNQ